MKKTLLVLFTTLITIGGFAQNNEAQQMLYNADRHYFIENKGQWHDDVLALLISEECLDNVRGWSSS